MEEELNGQHVYYILEYMELFLLLSYCVLPHILWRHYYRTQWRLKTLPPRSEHTTCINRRRRRIRKGDFISTIHLVETSVMSVYTRALDSGGAWKYNENLVNLIPGGWERDNVKS